MSRARTRPRRACRNALLRMLALAAPVLIAIADPRAAAADPRSAAIAAPPPAATAAGPVAQPQPAPMPQPLRLAASPENAADLCGNAIAAAERAYALPPGLLYAIGLVESGFHDAATGMRRPWPWTLDIDGKGRFFGSEHAALEAVAAIASADPRAADVDIGCLQVSLQQHPQAFGSPAEAFDPAKNADYAARYLTALHRAGLDWLEAAGSYHSNTPALAEPYRRLVEEVYAGFGGSPQPARSTSREPPAVSPGPALSAVRPQNLPPGLLPVGPARLRPPPGRAISPLALIRMLAIADALERIRRAEASRVAHVNLQRAARAAEAPPAR
jgi:hypothetical protein